MSKRKWEKSNVKITNLCDLLSSLEQFGGVWWLFRFFNSESIKNQQLRVLLHLIEKGILYFPNRIEGGNDGK